MRNYVGTETREDFAPFAGEALLFFSKEDTIFCDSLKRDLVDLMTDPVVMRDLKGGHLAMMASLDEYADTVARFVRERNASYR